MKTYNSITGYKPRTYNGRIITFGLNEEEIVFWIGSPKPDMELQMLFNCFENFDEMILVFSKLIY